MRLLAVELAAFLSLAMTVSALAADDGTAPVIIPGGVTDPAGKVGYLTNPKGGLVAIDLEKGDVLWESKDANRPLAVVGKRLAALASDKGALRVVVLDTEAKGKKLVATEPIKLPDWAVIGTGLDHGQAGKTFRARVGISKGNLELQWWATSSYYGGAAPTEEILRESMKNAAGVVRIDIESGKFDAKLADKQAQPTGTGLTEVEKLPKETQEVAKRENWQAGVVVGPRAYGTVVKQGKPAGFGRVQVVMIQAVDLKTGRLLWERAYEEQRILPPPP